MPLFYMRTKILQGLKTIKGNKNKVYSKDDAIDEMRELNNKLRNKLKELNSRMERILDNIKYKLILDQQSKEKPPETSEHKRQALEMEIKALKKQHEMSTVEIEQLNSKIQESTGFDKVFEIKELIEKEKTNNTFFKKTIRELKKSNHDQGNVIEDLTTSTHQHDNIMRLSDR